MGGKLAQSGAKNEAKLVDPAVGRRGISSGERSASVTFGFKPSGCECANNIATFNDFQRGCGGKPMCPPFCGRGEIGLRLRGFRATQGLHTQTP
jgi:hypothetical protein